MFSDLIHSVRRSLAFKLTLWYAVLFMGSLCAAFTVIYIFLAVEFLDRTDRDLERRLGHFTAMLAIKDIETVKESAFIEAQTSGEKEVFIRMLSPNGEIFLSSSMSYWRDLKVNTKAIRRLLEGELAVFETATLAASGRDVRIVYGFIGPGVILQFGQSLESSQRFQKALVPIFLVTLVVNLILAGGIGWLMSKRALAGVEAVTLTASRISSASLHERVFAAKKHGDEIDRLAATFNTMLDRIEDLVTGVREMNDNIAHDLRSPITRIRGLAEVTLTTGASAIEFENMAGSTIEECDRLLDMINTMLLISRTEAGVRSIRAEVLDLAALVKGACELFGPMADDRRITIICRAPDSFPYNGDIKMLQRMISNLLDNAIKYTRANGEVRVAVEKSKDGRVARITIADTGIGIDSGDIPLIFKRFFRCDESRSLPGTGLGLSLARAVAQVHSGGIRVSSHKGVGSTFTVDLPLNIAKW